MHDSITIEKLVVAINNANTFFLTQAQKQININLTIRNWIIGCYIIIYEQGGKDRAQYGDQVLDNIALFLKNKGVKGLGTTNLKLFRKFYLTYPQICRSLPDQFINGENDIINIRQSMTDEFNKQSLSDTESLINNLSFTHIVELLKEENINKRSFYEREAIKNNWSVRELNRAINTLLFDRLGLSTDKVGVIRNIKEEVIAKPEEIIKNPYLLDFLVLSEKPQFSETDLETAIIDHIQRFLLEMGRGFCFEARQKRITFGNTHYRIDLVFYHRILKCHVLVDLKVGEFSHADAGQMNVYLNYFKDKEMNKGDKDPIGIILCANKNEELVKYATTGLSQNVFVSKYLTSLPSEDELKKIIAEEKDKLSL